jgi:squalene cyclase
VENWLQRLSIDPLPLLHASSNEAILYFLRRDLLDEGVGAVEELWKLPQVEKILRKQQEDGSWKYPAGKEEIREQRSYNKLQTYKVLMDLVEKYGFTRKHPAIQRATEFLFTFQTGEGDFRGIYRDQYSPNYTAGMTELLAKAGYGDDPRIEKVFEWLLTMRQNDGGWALPMRTGVPKGTSTIKVAFWEEKPIQPDRSRPFSHWATGIVLRAFAAHEEYRRAAEAWAAGELLKSRFFKRDPYPDRQAASYWEKIRYPFWWTDILSSLDSLWWLGFSGEDEDIQKGLDWLVTNQGANGLWKARYVSGGDKDIHHWTTLHVCRVLKRYVG